MQRLHFLSGLPRSGSTLLASILRQNPQIHASIMSPIGHVVTDAVTAMGDQNEAHSFFAFGDRAAVVRGIMDAFYRDARPWVFDNSRRWTANMDLLATVYPDARVIAMVRPVPEIVDSFEQVFRKGALNPSRIYAGVSNLTVYGRYDALMAPGAVLRFAYDALRDAFYGPHKKNMLVLEYSALASNPQAVMDGLTNLLDLPKWDYDFNAILPIPGAAEFDQELSTPGLHALMPTVRHDKRPLIIPPDLVARCPPSFWRPVKESATSRP
jgi:sulfotransferase